MSPKAFDQLRIASRPPLTSKAMPSKRCFRRNCAPSGKSSRLAGAELADKISRDSGGSGELISRNVAEFDRTVKVHGGELLTRIGQHSSGIETALQTHLESPGADWTKVDEIRTNGEGLIDRVAAGCRRGRCHSSPCHRFDTQVGAKVDELRGHSEGVIERVGAQSAAIRDALHSHIDSFDGRVGSRVDEFSTALDQRFARVQAAIDGRTQTLNEALGARVLEIAKTLADGGKEVIGALEQDSTRSRVELMPRPPGSRACSANALTKSTAAWRPRARDCRQPRCPHRAL